MQEALLPYKTRHEHFLIMTAKMNSEVPVCCVPVTFTLLSFDFVPKIEMHLIYNEASKFN